MITLTIGNSESHIQGLDIKQHKLLKEVLSYELNPTASYFSGGYGPTKQSLLSAKGVFPTGLLHLVDSFLRNHRLYVDITDTRRQPKATEKLFSLNLGITPYREQIVAADRCEKFKRGIISAVTGFGKSITMALVINKLQLKTLIIVPNIELKRQLRENFEKYFGNLNNITIENIDSTSLKTHTNYDCLIIDEAHHVAAKTYRKLNKIAWKGIYYRFFFTATPFRSQAEEQILFESIAGQLIYKVDYQTAVSNGYIVPMEAYFIKIPSTKVSGTTWASVYSQLVVKNEVRNNIIADLLKGLKAEGKSTLCLVKEIQHGDTLGKAANCHFANGKNENTKDLIKFFSEGKINTLIGTTGIVGEGVDTRAAEYIIIAGLGKSKNAFFQQIGRGFRNFTGKESCKIILFLDNSHKFTKEHFKAQVKYLQEFGCEPVELFVDT